eukprot:CAMPEP_0184661020 /NCGR_PEP_ID=MMETSP0308-20130426/36602_1 /TAXON_ID=38269 /ORGANISM="Gloeochaete witrockiana, Strain SAG 46.84" /LENGTH=183 /DNA_ID=CAMNT_0027102035 /DNA_START=225 /DNA_END=777 /DNA_ORIENTATION=-
MASPLRRSYSSPSITWFAPSSSYAVPSASERPRGAPSPASYVLENPLPQSKNSTEVCSTTSYSDWRRLYSPSNDIRLSTLAGLPKKKKARRSRRGGVKIREREERKKAKQLLEEAISLHATILQEGEEEEGEEEEEDEPAQQQQQQQKPQKPQQQDYRAPTPILALPILPSPYETTLLHCRFP